MSKPRPLIDDDNRVFWEELKNHKFMLQHCNDCQKFIFYPRIICPHCYSENISWKETSGRGKIESYTVIHRAMPPFKDEVPYVVGIIQLNEGVKMISRLTNEKGDVAIGKDVSVVYQNIEEDLTLPYFQIIE
ncbi:Zn-ribbon domain-containing OB-fold protein [Niallia oryzisoli]|uniref:Zn-ribbon domain-containing OB-fold protein n=1 Tax=Niallia oryzisoli TaxID=1737571 RepID=A0ABZ2CB19_9BACI